MERPAGFWHTTAGVLTAVAGVLGSGATVLTALLAFGVFSPQGKADGSSPPAAGPSTTAQVSSTTPESDASTAPTQLSDEDFRATVYEGCVSDPTTGADHDTCSCWATEIVARITADEYWAAAAAVERGESAPPAVQAAVAEVAVACG
jgi:hypothetical protein